MTSLELQAESLTVLPQRLETIHLMSDPGSGNTAAVHQSNSFDPAGGRCVAGNCSVFNMQSNTTTVTQSITDPTRQSQTSGLLGGLLGLGGR